METLFKVKLQDSLYSLPFYQKGTFPSHFFSGNFQSNCSFEQIFRDDSERLHSKASLSKTKKAPNYQTFAHLHVLYRVNFLKKSLKRLNKNAHVGVLLQ